MKFMLLTAKTAPNVMKEIGRLREIAFRSAGGGTGKSMDVDEFDTMENCCRQLMFGTLRRKRLSVDIVISLVASGK